MRKSSRLLLVLLLFGATAAFLPRALGQGASDCIIRDDKALHAGSAPTPEGHFPHEEWAANPSSQRVVAAINRILDGEFGRSQEHAQNRPLASGLVGVVLDHYAQEIVVVVDTGRVDEAGLQGRLRQSAQSEGRGAPRIRVGHACHDSEALAAAADALAARAWHERADEIPLSFYLDPNTSVFQVTIPPEETEVAAALEDLLGDRVLVEPGTPQRDGRLNDGEPHYGGAGIHAGNESSNSCTSGFTVVLANGNKGSVTAGHCYSNGQNIYSGSEYYGKTDGESGFPTYDMIRIHPYGETFTNKIHVDPCCPEVRTVTSNGNPGDAEFICISGMVTKAVCGLEVKNLNAQLCDSSGCTPNLFRSEKPGELVRQRGDSGGPMYTRPTTTTASIKGMHIGGETRDESFAHKISTIKNHLNVSVSQ